MAGGVLVDQRRPKHRVERADAAARRPPARPRPGGRHPRRRRDVRAALRRRWSASMAPPCPPRTAPRSAEITSLSTLQRLGRANDAVDPLRVGRREHLFRRHVGQCAMPAAVEIRAPNERELGSRPMVRSVPGPWKCSASKLRSVIRSATATSTPPRCSQEATGSGSSSRHTRSMSSHSCSSAASAGMSGCTTAAQAGDGDGPIVQLMERSVIAFSHSLPAGERSRPSRSGSSPASTFGSVPPVRLMEAHRSARAARARSNSQLGAYPIEPSPP